MTEQVPQDRELAQIRDYARARVREASLRLVAKEVGIAHTTLRDFIREPDPREPYGVGRRRLMIWARERGVIPAVRSRGFAPVAEGAAKAAARARDTRQIRPPTDAVLTRIRQHLRALREGGATEEHLLLAEQEMRGGDLVHLRDQDPRDRTEEDWLYDVDVIYETERRLLEREGIAAAALSARRSPRVPPAAYQLVYEYCQRLEAAGVDEEVVEEARRLMSGETFNTLRKHTSDERDENGWIKDIQAAWAFIRDTLRQQGYAL